MDTNATNPEFIKITQEMAQEEVVRLVKLGRWAEERAIPALEYIHTRHGAVAKGALDMLQHFREDNANEKG